MEKKIVPIPGFPGYSISNYGEVYSSWSRAAGVNGRSGRGAVIVNSLRRIKPIPASGRWVVGLSRDGRRHVIRIHILVLNAFIGACPSGMEACHFPDRNTGNNRLDNLRWDTKASNQADKVFHGTSNRGERNGSCKLTTASVKEIRVSRKSGSTYKELARRYGCSVSNIQSICRGWTWNTAENGG